MTFIDLLMSLLASIAARNLSFLSSSILITIADGSSLGDSCGFSILTYSFFTPSITVWLVSVGWIASFAFVSSP